MNLIRTYRNWRACRQTVSELGQLSNRGLKDIGVSCSEIASVARQSI